MTICAKCGKNIGGQYYTGKKDEMIYSIHPFSKKTDGDDTDGTYIYAACLQNLIAYSFNEIKLCRQCNLMADKILRKWLNERKTLNERENLFKKVDDLDHVIHILEATANTYYNPNDKMWNVLLKARDKVSKPIETEKMSLYKKVDELDKKKKEK